MNALVKLPYELAWRAANAIVPLAPSSSNKIARTLRSRANLTAHIDTWAGAHRDTSRPLVWIHASSVGESLQALPVLKLLQDRNRDAQRVFTFYSPSAEAAVRQFPADFVSYLPFDTTGAMRHLVETLKPKALIFSKLDVWPTLVGEASRAGVKTGIISATLHADSGRRSSIASALLSDAYASLDAIGAISEEDRDNIIALGARADRVEVTGDTRYDQVWARRSSLGSRDVIDRLRSDGPTIVAGSTWKSDERNLLDAFTDLRKTNSRARLIIAPHEPSADTLEGIRVWADRNSLTHSRLDDPLASSVDVIGVDRVGVLGDLYALADVAYVGGGFHRAGLHSVLEPAAFGKPVLFGAPFGRTRDAELLVAAGAARAVNSSDELRSALSHWLTDSAARNLAGSAAEAVVKKGLGAAEASYELVKKLLS